MANYDFSLKATIEAGSMEDAISQVVTHLTTVSRNAGSGRELADCGALFTITENTKDKPKVSDLKTDVANEKLGPVELDLDPNSEQAIHLAEQKVEREAEAKAEEERQERGKLTDDDIIAELREKSAAEHDAAMAERVSNG